MIFFFLIFYHITSIPVCLKISLISWLKFKQIVLFLSKQYFLPITSTLLSHLFNYAKDKKIKVILAYFIRILPEMFSSLI